MKLNKLSRRGRAVLLTSIVFTLSLTLGLAGEGVVRVRQWINYGFIGGIENTYRTDASTGLRLPIPGVEFGPIRINSLGFRSPEIQVPKPGDRIRIAFLGASTTYCAEVSNNETTWPHLVIQQLSEQVPSDNLDYVNAGVPGFSVVHSLKNLQLRIRPLEPDVIIIYHATNDLAINARKIAQEQGLLEATDRRNMFWLSKYSLLSYLVEKNIEILRKEHTSRDPRTKIVFTAEPLNAPFKTDLEKLVRESKRIARQVVLVTFSNRLRRDQSPEEQITAAHTHLYHLPYFTLDGLLEGFAHYNDTIRQVASALNTLLIEVEMEIPGDMEHFIDSVHFTDKGSRVMADKVSHGLLSYNEFLALFNEERFSAR